MRFALLLLVALPALAQEYDVQRALIERDQQSAQFAARLRGAPLAEQQQIENHAAQLLIGVGKDLPAALRPYERHKAAQALAIAPPPPVARASASPAGKVQPLPAQLPGVVDVIPAGALQSLTRNH